MAKKTASNSTASTRQEVIALAYNNAVIKGWHATEASSWATKEYGSKIAKGDVQYYAMKHKLPYLDELKNGIRMKIL